jgi:glycosyltransferase involved in cell wall biosynthesis
MKQSFQWLARRNKSQNNDMMKVLFIASSVYIPDDKRKTVTGYDYIVSEIAQKLSEKCEIDLYLLRPYPRSCKMKSVSIIGHSNKDLLKYFQFREIPTYFKIAFKSKTDVKSRIRNVSYYLTMRDIERLIQKNKYDIVHIHGVTFMCALSSVAPARCKVPFLFTMHGLISYGIPNISQIDQMAEQAVLNLVRDNDFVITTVSTGTKMVPCQDKNINTYKVVVINNAVKNEDVVGSIDWRELYPQIFNKKVIISIGSVCPGKNQIQLLRAFNKLPDDIRSKTMIFLAGQDLSGGVVQEYVEKHHLKDNVVICGFLTKQELTGLYQVADYNALLSISEGFGLSMIEAAKYGIPTLTFSDLDAVKDLSPESMLVLNDRTDEAVADGIMKMMKTEWNKDAIIKSVDRFNEDIYFQYIDVYNQVIENKSNLINPEVILNVIGLS